MGIGPFCRRLSSFGLPTRQKITDLSMPKRRLEQNLVSMVQSSTADDFWDSLVQGDDEKEIEDKNRIESNPVNQDSSQKNNDEGEEENGDIVMIIKPDNSKPTFLDKLIEDERREVNIQERKRIEDILNFDHNLHAISEEMYDNVDTSFESYR